MPNYEAASWGLGRRGSGSCLLASCATRCERAMEGSDSSTAAHAANDVGAIISEDVQCCMVRFTSSTRCFASESGPGHLPFNHCAMSFGCRPLWPGLQLRLSPSVRIGWEALRVLELLQRQLYIYTMRFPVECMRCCQAWALNMLVFQGPAKSLLCPGVCLVPLLLSWVCVLKML